MAQDHGKGEYRGLPESYRDIFARYKTGYEGPCLIDNELHPVLPIPEWGIFCWWHNVTLTVPIASSDFFAAFTVPDNERAWVDAITWQRTGGDNTVDLIQGTVAEGYGSVSAVLDMLRLGTAAADGFWPDNGGIQATLQRQMAAPLLLEPGTILSVRGGGGGAAETTFAIQLAMRRMKLIRALVPFP